MNKYINNSKGSCPCCSFDLFLPPSEKGFVRSEAAHCFVDGNGEEETGHDDAVVGDLPQDIRHVASSLLLASSAADAGDGDDDDDALSTQVMIVDTHGHAQLNRDRDATYDLSGVVVGAVDASRRGQLKSLVCSVEPADFQATLDYASQSDCILPGLGVHPWYLEGLPKDGDSSSSSSWLEELETLLVAHPSCIVGEIGLCKVARWVRTYPGGKAAAMARQRDVFLKQMRLAARLQRPVSVHCVNAHGMFVSVIKELAAEHHPPPLQLQLQLPPAIGMHSFTGTAHHVKELLDLEGTIRKKQSSGSARNDTETGNIPLGPLFYFGFSHAVNYAMCSSDKARRKGAEAVEAVPLDRLMVESDVACAQDVLGGTIGAISYVAWACKMSHREVANITARNGLTFLGRCGTENRGHGETQS